MPTGIMFYYQFNFSALLNFHRCISEENRSISAYTAAFLQRNQFSDKPEQSDFLLCVINRLQQIQT